MHYVMQRTEVLADGLQNRTDDENVVKYGQKNQNTIENAEKYQ